jgi:Na+-driven multidrug efflux pump
MQIKLSDHFTYAKLLRFTLPSIVMMIFTSLYSVVDGLLVSNLVGDAALSAVNIMFPVAMLISAVGFMLGTGGSAVVARTLGEGKPELANRLFSMFLFAVVLAGGVLSVIGVAFVEPIARIAGASDALIEPCVSYGRILLAGSVPFMLQTSLQPFLVVAEKPNMGLILSLGSGVTNMVGDWVLIHLGISGAAWATVAGYCVGGVLPLLYFVRPRQGLRLVPTRMYICEFVQACGNGASELMSNISSSLVGILYNIELMHLIGEAGVAAHSVMMYVDFVFVAAFLGFSIGSAPVVSYHFGAQNHAELKNVFRKSLLLVLLTSAAMVVLSEGLSRPMCAAFVGYSPELLQLTVHGFRLFALCYVFCGINIYASSFFTALCNGALSAFISFLRSLLLRGGLVILLPLVLDLDGVWLAVVAAEGLAAVVSVILLWRQRTRYHYL